MSQQVGINNLPSMKRFQVTQLEAYFNIARCTIVSFLRCLDFFVVHNNQGALAFRVAKLLYFGGQIWKDNYFE